MSMMEAYFRQLVETLERKHAQKPTARRKFILEIGRVGERMFDGKHPTAFTTAFVPFEVLHSMGVSGMFVEFFGAMLAATGGAAPYLDRAEECGYSTDGCSYHKATIGAAVDGLLPAPDVLIAATCPCDGGVKAIERAAEIFGKKPFILNVPCSTDPYAVEYLVGQLEAMAEFITEETGRKLDRDLLRRTVRLHNEGRRYMNEAYEMCMTAPAPCGSGDLKNFLIYSLLSGTAEGVDVAKAFRDEFRDRLARGIHGVEAERFRLLWIQNRLQFANGLIETIEKDYRANVVIDELNWFFGGELDEADPMRALALRQIIHPLSGPIDRRLESLRMLARRFRVHGAINPAHLGCRQSGGAKFLFKEALAKVGVPLLHLDVDCVDERRFAEGQVRTRIEAFFEMLAEKQGREKP